MEEIIRNFILNRVNADIVLSIAIIAKKYLTYIVNQLLMVLNLFSMKNMEELTNSLNFISNQMEVMGLKTERVENI